MANTSATPPEIPTQTTPLHKSWWGLLKAVFAGWSEDKAPRLGAALAYYAVFSLAPLLVISLAVASFFFGAEAAQSQLHGQLQGFLGDQGAEAVESLLAAAHQPESGTIAMLLGVAALVFGASGVFGELQDSLNTIWQVQPKPGRGLWTAIRTRFLSFGMVLAVAFLLLVSLVVSTVLSALTTAVGNWIPGPDSLAWVINLVVSLATITVLFAMIFKFLPDVKIAWRDVWLGAFVTAGLFTIGKYLIGLYLGQASIGSAYGAAGSVVIVLLWTYYSAQIMFLGAEFTQAYAERRGSRIEPKTHAMALDSTLAFEPARQKSNATHF